MELLQQLLFDYTLRTVALGSGVLGVVSGALGVFALLRKQSLLGDAVSHAALPGIALAFLLTSSKASLVLIVGAAAAGWVAALIVMAIVNTTRIKTDGAMGMVLSVFFGFGLVLLTFIQKRPNASQAGLETFLFGQAATLLVENVVTMVVLGALALAVLVLLWKEFKLLSFDRAYAASLGFPVRFLEIVLTTLIVVAIVIGLQTVGVVLMSAMIVAPAAAARQWTDRLGVMVLLSGLFGAIAGVGGAMLSSSAANLPTGPTIVLVVTVIVVISMTLAPNRGLFWRWARQRSNRRNLEVERVLLSLYELALQHGSIDHGHSPRVLSLMDRRAGVVRSLGVLEDRGHVRRVDGDQWALTAPGRDMAEQMVEHRGGGS